MVAGDFVCAGPCAASLFGICESTWHPGLGPDELARVRARIVVVAPPAVSLLSITTNLISVFLTSNRQVCGECLLRAMGRDCFSGGGAVVHVLTADGQTSFELAVPAD